MSSLVVERVDGGPFDTGREPLVQYFHFDDTFLGNTTHRESFTCRTCPARVVLLGVVKRGEVTCQRCMHPMPFEEVGS